MFTEWVVVSNAICLHIYLSEVVLVVLHHRVYVALYLSINFFARDFLMLVPHTLAISKLLATECLAQSNKKDSINFHLLFSSSNIVLLLSPKAHNIRFRHALAIRNGYS